MILPTQINTAFQPRLGLFLGGVRSLRTELLADVEIEAEGMSTQ